MLLLFSKVLAPLPCASLDRAGLCKFHILCYRAMSRSLTLGCSICHRESNIQRCAACKVVSYCSKAHQAADWPAHKRWCKSVRASQQAFDHEEQSLREMEGEMRFARVFCGAIETSPHVRTRSGLIQALLRIDTREAVRSALEHAFGILHVSRSDRTRMRDLVPSLLLRLGKEQECYDFLKWWATTGRESNYQWSNTAVPYLDLKDANAFEAVDAFVRDGSDLCHSVSIALLKIRLLLVVKSLDIASLLAGSIPPEVLRLVRGKIASPIVAGNREVMDRDHVAPVVESLRSQVVTLFEAVKKANEFVWPAIIHHESRLLRFSPPRKQQEVEVVMKCCLRSWLETPGAIDVIAVISERRGEV